MPGTNKSRYETLFLAMSFLYVFGIPYQICIWIYQVLLYILDISCSTIKMHVQYEYGNYKKEDYKEL